MQAADLEGENRILSDILAALGQELTDPPHPLLPKGISSNSSGGAMDGFAESHPHTASTAALQQQEQQQQPGRRVQPAVDKPQQQQQQWRMPVREPQQQQQQQQQQGGVLPGLFMSPVKGLMQIPPEDTVTAATAAAAAAAADPVAQQRSEAAAAILREQHQGPGAARQHHAAAAAAGQASQHEPLTLSHCSHRPHPPQLSRHQQQQCHAVAVPRRLLPDFADSRILSRQARATAAAAAAAAAATAGGGRKPAAGLQANSSSSYGLRGRGAGQVGGGTNGGGSSSNALPALSCFDIPSHCGIWATGDLSTNACGLRSEQQQQPQQQQRLQRKQQRQQSGQPSASLELFGASWAPHPAHQPAWAAAHNPWPQQQQQQQEQHVMLPQQERQQQQQELQQLGGGPDVPAIPSRNQPPLENADTATAAAAAGAPPQQQQQQQQQQGGLLRLLGDTMGSALHHGGLMSPSRANSPAGDRAAGEPPAPTAVALHQEHHQQQQQQQQGVGVSQDQHHSNSKGVPSHGQQQQWALPLPSNRAPAGSPAQQQQQQEQAMLKCMGFPGLQNPYQGEGGEDLIPVRRGREGASSPQHTSLAAAQRLQLWSYPRTAVTAAAGTESAAGQLLPAHALQQQQQQHCRQAAGVFPQGQWEPDENFVGFSSPKEYSCRSSVYVPPIAAENSSRSVQSAVLLASVELRQLNGDAAVAEAVAAAAKCRNMCDDLHLQLASMLGAPAESSALAAALDAPAAIGCPAAAGRVTTNTADGVTTMRSGRSSRNSSKRGSSVLFEQWTELQRQVQEVEGLMLESEGISPEASSLAPPPTGSDTAAAPAPAAAGRSREGPGTQLSNNSSSSEDMQHANAQDAHDAVSQAVTTADALSSQALVNVAVNMIGTHLRVCQTDPGSTANTHAQQQQQQQQQQHVFVREGGELHTTRSQPAAAAGAQRPGGGRWSLGLPSLRELLPHSLRG